MCLLRTSYLSRRRRRRCRRRCPTSVRVVITILSFTFTFAVTGPFTVCPFSIVSFCFAVRDENIAGASSGRCRQIASGRVRKLQFNIVLRLKSLIFNIFYCRAMFRSRRPSDDDVVAMAGPRNFTIIRAPRYHSRRRLYLFSLSYPYPSDRLTADHPVSNTRGDGPATSENELKYRKQTESIIIILLFLFSVSTAP